MFLSSFNNIAAIVVIDIVDKIVNFFMVIIIIMGIDIAIIVVFIVAILIIILSINIIVIIIITSMNPVSPAFSKQLLTLGSTLIPPKAEISPNTRGTWS